MRGRNIEYSWGGARVDVNLEGNGKEGSKREYKGRRAKRK